MGGRPLVTIRLLHPHRRLPSSWYGGELIATGWRDLEYVNFTAVHVAISSVTSCAPAILLRQCQTCSLVRWSLFSPFLWALKS